MHNEWLGINGAVPTIFGDINGDGVVNVTDYNDVREEIGAVLPSANIWTVNSLGDSGTGSGFSGDLLYCITQANANPNPLGSVIEFDPAVFGSAQTIALSSTLELSETAGPEVIDGPGAESRDGERQQRGRGVLDWERRDGPAHRPDHLEWIGRSGRRPLYRRRHGFTDKCGREQQPGRGSQRGCRRRSSIGTGRSRW